MRVVASAAAAIRNATKGLHSFCTIGALETRFSKGFSRKNNVIRSMSHGSTADGTKQNPAARNFEGFCENEREALSVPGLVLRSPQKEQPAEKMNMCQAINSALDIALGSNPRAVIFGEDVAFGGVFRCTLGLQERYGSKRVFNTPLTEQGVAGFGIGLAAQGGVAVVEIQFADYVFPAFDQLVNEAAKWRYRSGGQYSCGGLTVRMPGMAVGHGGLYHSQSPEAYFAHTPGLRVVIPRGALQAKGLLLASIRSQDPVIFIEPKALYRAASEFVPKGDFELPIDKADVLWGGKPNSKPLATLVAWGAQLHVLARAARMVAEENGKQAESMFELIDLRCIAPWDARTVVSSVQRTGRLVVAHEAPITGGFAGEIAATVLRDCFLHLEAPVERVCGFDTPFPLAHEALYLPGIARCADAIRRSLSF